MELSKQLPLFHRETSTALSATEQYIEHALVSANSVISEAAHYLLKSGGKRLRPGMLFLSGRCGDYDEGKLIPVAAALEIIHMASLIHDDIVDHAPLRRGKATVAAKYGDDVALFTGNFMVAKAMELALESGDAHIRDVAAATAAAMCRGEFAQLRSMAKPCFRTDAYLIQIKRKTAYLFSAACELGAYLSGAEEKIVRALRIYGEYLGMAFQITDDILDFQTGDCCSGKVPGNDIREGLLTLPLIYAGQEGGCRQGIEKVFRKTAKTDEDIARVVAAVRDSGGNERASKLAGRYIAKAKKKLSVINDGAVRDCFLEIADFVAARKI